MVRARHTESCMKVLFGTFNNGLAPGSDTDDEDKLHIVEEADGAECDGTLPDEEHPRDHHWDRVREEALSELSDDRSTDALVEEILQQGDTAVIYPEAPEDEPARPETPETAGPDENGTPDSFSQLLTCPFCSRGYKRYSSLKEHIKYRHEKSDDSYNCPECSYSFSHRAQLERHMSAHKAPRDQRHITQSTGNRKFKCTECGKAFKYKHHLKEHLRIHSGEKPYECSNCKKRFSHSGSYSSHISSKKCISVVSVNGRPRPVPKALGPPTPPSRLEHKPLQEQLPLTQIKAEPVDYEYKASVTAPSAGLFQGGAAPLHGAPLQGTVQALVLPTVGLVSPISINIADLHNALKVAVDGNVIRQVLEGKGQTPGTPQQQQIISAISLPILGQDGNTKIIINYSLDPSQAQKLKKEVVCAGEKLPEDLTVKGVKVKQEEEESCSLCDHCPAGLEALHALKHAQGPKCEGSACSQPKHLLSLLKAYHPLSPEATQEQPKMCTASLPEHLDQDSAVSLVPGKDTSAMSPSVNRDSPTEATPAEALHSCPASPSQAPDTPLDLSLPKSMAEKEPGSSCSSVADQPLNLTCLKREGVYSGQASPVSLHLPALVALAEQGGGGKRTILIPQLAYSYTPAATSPAGTETQEAAIQLNGIKEERADSESLSAADEPDSDCGPTRKKMKKTESGLYACDLCDKIFQKSSSLLRHKYEHTGKRPHECGICAKAFKHKHHLIEHMRLHSGEKPYQCDKCGKRFSHSGSYSQHMNHRYSYCKRDPAQQLQQEHSLKDLAPVTDEDERATLLLAPLQRTPYQTDSDERASRDSEEDDEMDEDGAAGIEDIRVVQVEDDDEMEEDTRQNEPGEDTRQDEVSEEILETSREPSEEGSKESSKKASREFSKEVSLEVIKETSVETSEKASGGVSEEASMEVSEKASKDPSKKASEELSEEVSMEVSEEASKDTSEATSEQKSEEVSKEVSEGASKDTSDAASAEVLKEVSEGASDETSKGVSEEDCNKTTKGVSEEASDETSNGVSEVASDETSKGVSEEAFDETSKGVSEEASDETSKDISEKVSDEILEEASNEVSKDTSKTEVDVDRGD
uniref:C2H2-type domain-containing protein n=1 Tax=Knipowitschia caucasica TaxID=637954 RepID=A0AAV2JIN9_KNICA